MRGVFIVAKVAISRASYSFDALYSYSVPEELAQKVKSGVRVLVPFGRGNRKAVGFVARTYTEAEYEYEDISEDSIGYYQRWKEKYLK